MRAVPSSVVSSASCITNGTYYSWGGKNAQTESNIALKSHNYFMLDNHRENVSLKATVQSEMHMSGRHSFIRERPEKYRLEGWSGTCLEVGKLLDSTFCCVCLAVGTVSNRHQRKTSQHPDSVPGPSPKCGSQWSLEAILATSWKLSWQAATSWELPAYTACLSLFLLQLWHAPYAEYCRKEPAYLAEFGLWPEFL